MTADSVPAPTTQGERVPYPADLYPGCPCYACDSTTWPSLYGIPMARMSLCPTCGNKRCPGAAHHDNDCSGSNAPGQAGSLYANTEPVDLDIAALLDEVRAKRKANDDDR